MSPRSPWRKFPHFLLLVVACLFTTVASTGNVAAAAETGGKHIIGYYPDWASGFVNSIQYDQLTHVNYFAIGPHPDGSLNTASITPSRLQQVTNDAHAAGVTASITVGGGSRSEGFPAMAASESARADFIENILDFMGQYNLDGVDLNWEPVDTAAKMDNYSTLLEELRSAMPPGKLLSVAVSPHTLNIRSWAVDDLDWIAVMGYDFNWGSAEHSTFDDAVAAMSFWEGLPAPRNKLVMGVPFYGRGDGGNAQKYSWIVDNYDPAPGDDWAGPYFFNGIETIRAKTAYVYDNDYAGVMIWNLSQDKMDQRSLLLAIAEEAALYQDPAPPANQLPTADAGPDQTFSDADGDGVETVTLSGSGFDPDGTVVSYQWKEGSTVLGETASLTTELDVANSPHYLTLMVTDDSGATGSDTVVITVEAPAVKDEWSSGDLESGVWSVSGNRKGRIARKDYSYQPPASIKSLQQLKVTINIAALETSGSLNSDGAPPYLEAWILNKKKPMHQIGSTLTPSATGIYTFESTSAEVISSISQGKTNQIRLIMGSLNQDKASGANDRMDIDLAEIQITHGP